jgi:signal transduction histidine kinase
MVGDEPGEVVGSHASDVFDTVPGLYEHYADLDEGVEEVTVDAGDRIRRYRVEVTPLSGARDDDGGRVVVARDVTDRFERERELERQNEQLEQFASLVSHDLRNPLSVADGYVGLVGDRTDDPEIEEYVDQVARSHDRMERIIEDVLTMARQGQTIDETRAVDLGDLARRAWSNVDTGEATLENDLSTVVEGDPDRLLHVFENLFRNAVEHGGPDVTVRVGPISRPAFEAGKNVGSGFFVADDGPGIPEERRETVFEAGHTTHSEGTGLGLSIVEQFVEAHGWSIRVTESADGGARFEVTGVPGVDAPTEAPVGHPGS